MAWKKLGEDTTEIWNFDDIPVLEGVFKEVKKSLGKNETNLYMIESNNDLYGVWGSTSLKEKLDQVKVDEAVRIEFLGMRKSKNGHEYRHFDVSIWVE